MMRDYISPPSARQLPQVASSTFTLDQLFNDNERVGSFNGRV
jgi:hypothetical protein